MLDPKLHWSERKWKADLAAKSALDLTLNNFRIPYTDLKPKINKFLHTKWQQRWNDSTHNKLFQFQPTLGEWRPASRKSRTSHILIEHWSYKAYLLFHTETEKQPQCLTCQTPCTVKHVLIEYRAFALVRKRFFKVNSLIGLFKNIKIDDVLSLRETGLYQKIWIETS